MVAAKNYVGFSSAGWGNRRSFKLTDLELVKQDLLNHIYTVKGERVMMPGFGTRIPVLPFEPNDEKTRLVIETDLTEVFNYDPRVSIISLNVASAPDSNKIVAVAVLLYVEFNVTDELRIEIPTK